jgi:hypothetical protein
LKGFDQQIVQFKMVAGLKQPPINPQFQINVQTLSTFRIGGHGFSFAAQFRFERPNRGVLRIAIAKNGDVKFIGNPQQPHNVIAVLVGDQNGREIFRSAANGGQALANLAGRKPGIHQDAGFGGLDVGAIAGRTASQNSELYGHSLKLVAGEATGKCF